VITDNIKALLLMILGVLLLLSVCVSVDYAANDTITVEQEQMNTSNCTLIGGVHYDDMIVNRSNKHIESYNVVVMKPKYPTISMWAKPSVRSSYAYRWYKKTFIDYCPHCHYYGVLLKNPKGVPEREYTCRRCGADYCAVTGKEKYSWSNYYLRRL
jgi:hypothetical protein